MQLQRQRPVMLQVNAACVPRLIALVTCGHMNIAVQASGALAAIVNSPHGTEALLASGEALLFVELLDWLEPGLERNVLAIIDNACKHAEMRKCFVVRFCSLAALDIVCCQGSFLATEPKQTHRTGKRSRCVQDAGVLQELQKSLRPELQKSATTRLAAASAYRQCTFQHMPMPRLQIQDPQVSL